MPADHGALLGEYMAAYNAGDLDGLDGFVTEGYVHHSNAHALSLAQFKAGAAWMRTVMPDFRIDVEDMVVADDRGAVLFTGRGTHTGSAFGETPTGGAIAIHGIMYYRFEDGRIAEDWEGLDEHDLRRQLGALAPA